MTGRSVCIIQTVYISCLCMFSFAFQCFCLFLHFKRKPCSSFVAPPGACAPCRGRYQWEVLIVVVLLMGDFEGDGPFHCVLSMSRPAGVAPPACRAGQARKEHETHQEAFTFQVSVSPAAQMHTKPFTKCITHTNPEAKGGTGAYTRRQAN